MASENINPASSPLWDVLIAGFPTEESEQIKEGVSRALNFCNFYFANTYEDYLSIIKRVPFEVIISNHNFNYFNALSALKVAIEYNPNSIFIILSALEDIYTAVEFIKNGASDYILKRDINKLPYAVCKAIEGMQAKKDLTKEELRSQNELITSLITKAEWFDQDLITNIKRVLETCSELLKVERVSLWIYTEDYSKIKCLDLYERSKNRHSSGEILFSSTFSNYVDLHKRGSVVAAFDVYSDPITREIPREYFIKNGISSLLDAPIYFGGKLFGLLSFEHVGINRHWDSIEERLALIMAAHLSLFFEIDKRKKIEQELHDSKVFYKTVFDSSHEGFLIIADVIIECNESASKILGYPKEEIVGVSLAELSPELQSNGRSSEEVASNYIESAKKGQLQKFEWNFKRKDGTLIDTEMSLIPLPFTEKALFFATFVDITKQKQAHLALLEAEEKYKNIFENAVEGIFQTTPEGRFITANPALARMYGYETPEEFIADIKDIAQQLYYDPSDREVFLQIIKEKGFISNHEMRARHRDGSLFWISLSARAVYDDFGRIKFFEGMVEDITERKKLEQQLRQSQKMEAIGTLAGGIAHDFNNILTAILGYSQLMLVQLKDSDPLKGYLEKIISAAEKATNLIKSLLAFSRKQLISLVPINLNNLIEHLTDMIKRIIGEDIELRVFLSKEDLIVPADKNMIEQVLLNLATNSRDAMPDGGAIIIETDKVLLDESYIADHGYGKPGIYALISFTDSGIGMDKETIQKIFEPFFTTKGRDKGTGLGLSMVYGIIKQHNGYINCYSELNKGTTFKIYLPITTEEPHKRTYPERVSNLEGKETILLAEDDSSVRKLIKSILEKYGYRVIEAEDGLDAVEKYSRNREDIDLLIFDIIMPKLNGRLAYEQIKKVRPSIPVLFISGYTEDFIQQKGILEERVNLLLKPLSPEKILTKIREILSRGT
ncbi:MAG: PAS domain S-box protein [Thermodesulfovibrionales bacterium]|nr:PAS domain S-box protein [Thermodesulfovibrionales bacterium]